jgi:short-subunit dehydrogenase
MNTKFAVITGASSGIGFEIAKLFVEDGYDVLICSQSDQLQAAKKQLEDISNGTVAAVQVDLAKPEGVEELYQNILAVGKPLNAIALNAGVGVGGDFVRQTDLEKELNLIDLNCRSTVQLAKLAGKIMVRQGFGRMLFTSSIAADMIGSFEAVYNASKAFVQYFALAIREELKDTGITVTCLQPGPTETNFFHRADMDDTKVGTDPKDDAAEVARQGYEAMLAGKDHVVAGSFKNKIFSVVGRLVPQTTSAKIHRGMSEPGTGKH